MKSSGKDWPWNVPPTVGGAALDHGHLPKISIVTPSYNQGAYIEETIRSILLQGYPNLEYVIMDGGSRDNTVEVIKKYEDQIDFWVSEKDRGQSHAINKGIARCSGEIFNWINSDDLLMPGALWAVAEAWQRKPGTIIAGNTELFDETGTTEIVKARDQSLRNFVRFWDATNFGWAQQSTFVPLSELKAIGGIREDLVFCMDHVMMVRLLMRNDSVLYVDQPLARFRAHPQSKTLGASKDFRLEKVNALRALTDLPVGVAPWEWDAESARRLVDMARHAGRAGKHLRAATTIGQAIRTNPRAALSEIWRRALTKSRTKRDSAKTAESLLP